MQMCIDGKTLLWTLVVCSATACAGDLADRPDDGALAVDEQSIIGGTTDTGDPSVVAVFVHAPGATSGSLCTGTVIGPHTVLTAAHCVSPAIVGAGQVFELLSGTTITLPGIVASSTTFDPAFDINNLFAGHDIGIIHTAGALPFASVAIAPVALALPVQLVGYGADTHANTGVGTKRQMTTNIVAASGVLIQDGNSNMQTCHGDSGGPAFQTVGSTQVVVGVTSFGQDQPPSVCFNGGFHVRVDSELGFITSNTN
jgi:V8-like Glu-specific endopeptidase